MSNVSQRIKTIRESKDLSQQEVADVLGLSRPTYIAIESGKREPNVSELNTIAGIFGMTLEELLFETNNSTISDSTYIKFKELILNCLQYGSDDRDNKITKTKLAKLVYLSDFTWYFFHSVPMTGVNYRRIHQGPVADAYFRVIDELFETGAISIEQSGLAMMIKANESAPRTKINDEELDLIKAICTNWKGKPTSEIVEFTHNQIPFKTVSAGDLVPYELIKRESESNLY